MKNYISMIIICIDKHNAQHNKQIHVQKIDLNPIFTGGVEKTFVPMKTDDFSKKIETIQSYNL